MMYDGERVEPGAVLTLAPVAAVECLASGRAEFVDAADAERARAAIESANNSTLRRLSSPTDFSPPNRTPCGVRLHGRRASLAPT